MLRSELDDIDFYGGTVTIRENKQVRRLFTSRSVVFSLLIRRLLRGWVKCNPGDRFTFLTWVLLARQKQSRIDFDRSPVTRLMTNSNGPWPERTGRSLAARPVDFVPRASILRRTVNTLSSLISELIIRAELV